MIQSAKAPGTPGSPINIQDRMDAFFGVVDMCREIALSAMVSQGRTRDQAEAEWRRLRHEAFLQRERPPFSRRFPNAGLWKSR
jgi:hypothetical protein